MSRQLISVDQMVRMAMMGEGWRQWYQRARHELEVVADYYDHLYDHVHAVAAILSPRCSVRRNMRLVGMWCRSQPLPADVYGMKRDALELWWNKGTMSGPKVRAFYDCLRGNLNSVVLDTWMSKALIVGGGEWPKREENPLRRAAVNAITTASSILEWKPAEVQAAIWAATYRMIRGSEPPHFMASDALEIRHEANKQRASRRDRPGDGHCSGAGVDGGAITGLRGGCAG